MIFHDVQQSTEEWARLRLGIPTASSFDRIMTPKKMQLSSAADGYIAELIGDRLSPYMPDRVETFTNRAIEWGKQTEEEARRFYAMDQNATVTNGGFCTDDAGQIGSSPDGLCGDDGCIEIKCPQPGTHVQYLIDGGLPDAYKCQVHGHLIVTGRKYCDFLSYSLGLPPFLIRVEPNEFTLALSKCIYEQFLPRFDELYAKIKARMG